MDSYVYEPSEDSYFLIDCLKELVKKRKFKKVLEVGTGSGIISLEIANKVGEILAVDINKKAIKVAKENKRKYKVENVEFRVSDLFDKVKGKFDLIFFNPPYLPGKGDLSCCGGEKGQEVIERFLGEVSNYLEEKGVAIILLSSFNSVKELKKKYNLKLIKKKKLWFETLYCYRTNTL